MERKMKRMKAAQREAIKVSKSIDWLSVTYWNDIKMLSVYPPLDGCKPQLPCKPLHGYDTAERLHCGGIRMWHQNRESMGIHYQYSGDALAKLRLECGGDDVLLMRSLYHEQIKQVSRIDIAVDVFHVGQVDDLEREANKDRLKSRLKPHSIHKDWQMPKNAKTLYFGSPTSDFRVRCYDKAHEMQSLWEAWTRIEAQMRNETANGVYRDIVMSGTLEGAVKTVHNRFDFPNLEWFQYAMTTEGEAVQVPHKPTDFEKWMRRQVIPAIANHIQGDVDSPAIVDLYHMLHEYFDGIPF